MEWILDVKGINSYDAAGTNKWFEYTLSIVSHVVSHIFT